MTLDKRSENASLPTGMVIEGVGDVKGSEGVGGKLNCHGAVVGLGVDTTIVTSGGWKVVGLNSL